MANVKAWAKGGGRKAPKKKGPGDPARDVPQKPPVPQGKAADGK